MLSFLPRQSRTRTRTVPGTTIEPIRLLDQRRGRPMSGVGSPRLSHGPASTVWIVGSDRRQRSSVPWPMPQSGRQSVADRPFRTVCERSNSSLSSRSLVSPSSIFSLLVVCAPRPSPLAFGGWIQADPSKMDFCRVGSVAGPGTPGGSPPSGFPCTHFSAVRVRSQAASERQAASRFGRQGRGPSFSRPSPSVPGQSAVGCPYS